MRGRVVCTASASLDASEFTHTFYPAGGARPGYPVIFCHGAGLDDMIVANSGWPHGALLGRVLSRAGIATAQIYGNGTNMANDTGLDRITTALSTLATRTGCSSTKCHLVGISMGGAWATRYAALNPAKVASVNALIPLSSIINLYKQNPGQPVVGGFTQMVATAWGTTYHTIADGVLTSGSPNVDSAGGSFTSADVGSFVVTNTGSQGAFNNKVPIGTTILSQTGTSAVMSANATGSGTSQRVGFAPPLPTSSPNADLVALAATIKSNGIPGRLFYSSVDAYVPAADVTALATAAGWSATVVDSTFGHADGTLNEWASYNGGSQFSDLVTYLTARGA